MIFMCRQIKMDFYELISTKCVVDQIHSYRCCYGSRDLFRSLAILTFLGGCDLFVVGECCSSFGSFCLVAEFSHVAVVQAQLIGIFLRGKDTSCLCYFRFNGLLVVTEVSDKVCASPSTSSVFNSGSLVFHSNRVRSGDSPFSIPVHIMISWLRVEESQ